MHDHVCLGFFGGTPFWHMQKCSKSLRSASIFYTYTERLTRMCPYLDSDVWAGCFTIIFVGSFHYFKPVSCWILFCENVAGVPWPFDQLPSHVGKVNTFKTPEMRLYFDPDVWGGCLTIIFVRSFPYLKFLSAKLTVKWDESSRPKIGQ